MSAELLKSKFVRRPSSDCGIDYLWTYCMDFFQILVVASPGSYAGTWFFFFFWFFKKYPIVRNMVPYGSKRFQKRYCSFKSLVYLFKLFLNFLLSGPHKNSVLDFWNFEFRIFQDFFVVVVVETSLEFSSKWASQKRTVLDFWNFAFLSFNEFLKFTIVTYGETKTSISEFTCKTSGRRAKQSEIWGSRVSVQSIQISFDS